MKKILILMSVLSLLVVSILYISPKLLVSVISHRMSNKLGTNVNVQNVKINWAIPIEIIIDDVSFEKSFEETLMTAQFTFTKSLWSIPDLFRAFSHDNFQYYAEHITVLKGDLYLDQINMGKESNRASSASEGLKQIKSQFQKIFNKSETLNLQINIKIAHLVLRSFKMNGVVGELYSDNRRLIVKFHWPEKMFSKHNPNANQAAVFHSEISLVEEDLFIKANVSGYNLLFEDVFDLPDIEDKFQSLLSGHAKLTFRGKSFDHMMNSLDGQIDIIITDGRVQELISSLASAEVLGTLVDVFQGYQMQTVRCAAVGFDVVNGFMSSREVVLDLEDVKYTSHGEIDLSNKKMDMRINTHAKDISLLSAQPAYRVHGDLYSPSVSPLEAATFLSMLTPIEFGWGQSVDCRELIEQAGFQCSDESCKMVELNLYQDQ